MSVTEVVIYFRDVDQKFRKISASFNAHMKMYELYIYLSRKQIPWSGCVLQDYHKKVVTPSECINKRKVLTVVRDPANHQVVKQEIESYYLLPYTQKMYLQLLDLKRRVDILQQQEMQLRHEIEILHSF